MLKRVAPGAQRTDKIGDQAEGIVEWGEAGDLRTDVNIDSGDLYPRKPRGFGIYLSGATNRDAEFVLRLAGGNLGMGFGIDIGIDPERRAGRPVLTCCNFGKKGKLRLRIRR